MPKTLRTNQSAWIKVFRKVIATLETDPDFRRVVGQDSLRSWSGIPGDKAPMEPSLGRPVVRLTPNPSAVEWYDPSSQVGTLSVRVEVVVQSLCVDDCIDLYDLIEQALLPGRGTLRQELVALGAETGEIVFSDPAFDPKPEVEPDGYIVGEGRFHIRILRSLA